MSLDDDFVQATKKVNASSNLGNAQMLEFYGLYKQATAGDARGGRPGTFDLRGRAKYDAWEARKGLTSEQAKKLYIDAAAKLS
jgi:diazepam-binding inhibitor (GABA receptor modulating acyl-CoA-binding protein)